MSDPTATLRALADACDACATFDRDIRSQSMCNAMQRDALMCALPHGGWPATADELRAMADEVERLRAAAKPDPLRAVLERVPATGAPFELSYHPSDVGDPGWTSVVAGYVDYGTLPDVLRAMVGRVSDG